jgi:hypothetical protein
MPIITPVINPEQGGQGAITFMGWGKKPALLVAYEQSRVDANQGAPLVTQAITPVFPAIVQPPAVPLPSQLTPQLPSMAPGQVTPGTGMSCKDQAGGSGRGCVDAELDYRGWECKLGDWVSGNPGKAIGVIVLAYLVTHAGKR